MSEQTKLFHYQQIGAEWLTRHPRAILADEMGLGKSAQVIAAAEMIGLHKILIVCPAIARLNWLRQFQKFSKRESVYFPVPLLDSTKRPLTMSGLICSYDLMVNKKIFTWISAQNWDLIILDEVHYLKNRNAQRTRAIFGRLICSARYVWALSGTPVPNHAGELYPILHAFGVYNDSYWSFVRRYCYCRETPFGTEVKGVRRADELRTLFAPVLLRRKKEDVIKDLPSILFADVAIEPGPVDVARWYPETENHFSTPERLAKVIAEQQAAIDAVVNLTGLGEDGLTALGSLQVKCMKSRRYTGLQKVQAAVEIISEELRSGAYEKIVIFAVHRHVIEDIWERMRKEFNAAMIFGGTEPKERDKRVRRFQTDPKYRVLVGNIQAAGVAISLTAAHQVVFVESSWVPAENAQAAMRVHRIGQTKPVTVRFFNLAGSSDEKIQRVLCRKTADIAKLFERDSSCSKGTDRDRIDIFN